MLAQALNPFSWCAKALQKIGHVMPLVTLTIFGFSMFHTNYALIRRKYEGHYLMLRFHMVLSINV